MCLFHDHSVTVEHFSYSVLTTHKVFVTSNNVEKIITTLFDSDAHLEDLTSSGLCYTTFFTSFYTAFTHFGEIVRKFLFTPYILDCIFFFFATLHSRLSSWKRTLCETDESLSSSRTSHISRSRSVHYHFQKNNWTLTWSRRSQSAPVYSRHLRSLYFGVSLPVYSLHVLIKLCVCVCVCGTVASSTHVTHSALIIFLDISCRAYLSAFLKYFKSE